MRAVTLWLVAWGLATAAMRPLSGEPFAEMIERAGNYGVPFMLLVLSGMGTKNISSWFTRIDPDPAVDPAKLHKITTYLKVIVFLLLVGHGWLNLIEKKGLMGQYTSLGFSNPALVAHVAGIFEIVAGLSVLIRPFRTVILTLLIWKVGTELFYPHWEAFEWIERGGSYGTLLALWFALPSSLSFNTTNKLVTE
jgi:uncharacterized membrane protein YphA (DoxX/SURF4 family)